MKWAEQPRTLEEIESLPTEVLTCANVAKVLGANPACIHAQAMSKPESLGFRTIIHGTRVLIPKKPFLQFMRGEPC